MEDNEIQNLVDTLLGWHVNAVQTAEHLYDVSTDGSVTAEIKDNETNQVTVVTITEENKEAFFLGITIVLSLFNKLPIDFEETNNEEEEETT